MFFDYANVKIFYFLIYNMCASTLLIKKILPVQSVIHEQPSIPEC